MSLDLSQSELAYVTSLPTDARKRTIAEIARVKTSILVSGTANIDMTVETREILLPFIEEVVATRERLEKGF